MTGLVCSHTPTNDSFAQLRDAFNSEKPCPVLCRVYFPVNAAGTSASLINLGMYIPKFWSLDYLISAWCSGRR